MNPVDPWTYGAAALSIVTIAWLATNVLSRKADVVDSVKALRGEWVVRD